MAAALISVPFNPLSRLRNALLPPSPPSLLSLSLSPFSMIISRRRGVRGRKRFIYLFGKSDTNFSPSLTVFSLMLLFVGKTSWVV